MRESNPLAERVCIYLTQSVLRITLGGPSFIKLHEYERSRGWKNPTDAQDNPLMHAHRTDLHYFDLAASRGCLDDFNHHMAGYRRGRLPWMAPGFVPVREVLVRGADPGPDAVFLVDVGGGLGHDLLEFHRYHPSVPGRLVVQDLPQVVGSIVPSEENKGLTPMAHNFFDEQPIKGDVPHATFSSYHFLSFSSFSSFFSFYLFFLFFFYIILFPY